MEAKDVIKAYYELTMQKFLNVQERLATKVSDLKWVSSKEEANRFPELYDRALQVHNMLEYQCKNRDHAMLVIRRDTNERCIRLYDESDKPTDFYQYYKVVIAAMYRAGDWWVQYTWRKPGVAFMKLSDFLYKLAVEWNNKSVGDFWLDLPEMAAYNVQWNCKHIRLWDCIDFAMDCGLGYPKNFENPKFEYCALDVLPKELRSKENVQAVVNKMNEEYMAIGRAQITNIQLAGISHTIGEPIDLPYVDERTVHKSTFNLEHLRHTEDMMNYEYIIEPGAVTINKICN